MIIYYLIQGNFEVLIHPELNSKFYVILTGDGANTMIVSELTGALEEIVIGSKQKIQAFDNQQIQSVYLLFAKLYPVFIFLLLSN